MEKLLTSFRDRIEEGIQHFLWRQWDALGVAGTAQEEDRWIIDPEALLVFTLETARKDPRLFDEALDWLVSNGSAIDVQRVRNIVRTDADYPAGLVRAAASFLAEREPSAKWKRLAGPRRGRAPRQRPEALFLIGEDTGPPRLRGSERHFARQGFVRDEMRLKGLSRSIPFNAPVCMRFRLRAFFGIASRAEIVAYLLAHDDGHASEIAQSVAYSAPGVYEVLRDMAESGLVHVRRRGREKRYWIERRRWGEFLHNGSGGGGQPGWVDWIVLFRGLARILRFTRTADLERMTDYVGMSEFRRVVDEATEDLEGAGLPLHIPRQQGMTIFELAPLIVGALENFVQTLWGEAVER